MRHATFLGSTTLTTVTLWLIVISAIPSSASPYHNNIKHVYRDTMRPNSVFMAESIIERGQGLGLKNDDEPSINYEHGTFQHALWNLYRYTNNDTYLYLIKEAIDHIVTPAGKVVGEYDPEAYSLDNIRVMESMIHLWQLTKEEKYKIAAGELQNQMKTQPRTAEGAFWHKDKYVQQQWLDGIYMAHYSYALYATTFEPDTAEEVFKDIELQFSLVWKHCRDNKTGLLRHGYDYSKRQVWADPITGASPEVWDRALGWYFMSLIELLSPTSPIPRTHPASTTLLSQLRALTPALLRNADPTTGAWFLVMSQPGDRKGNYIESSGTVMFIYTLLKALRLSLVDDTDGTILKAARKAYEYILKEMIWIEDGEMMMRGTVKVGSLKSNGTFEYYTSIPTEINDLKGTGPFVMASLEYERLNDIAKGDIQQR
ncbi:glycosyl hydrolase [Venturia nashicola]|uniref:Glycosyl hydrolase n=1 Tax=Venturia nashicola TaxID=86259 RepID=A0A4Z1PFF6_9PEZI|nr:glycosyl hydrolase [Venturia nashicola]TLD32011.1 glycosyl hydrolase [Venturia nashicola]